ncbi:MAG: hypothetical protein KGI67_02295 [Pseudomonadota bacterium]|nr:hypothetical protein [Pseudomonadota bacterium]
MPLSRSAQLQYLADLALEELELLEAPAARLSGSSRGLSAERIRGLRRQAALLRATAAALEPRLAECEAGEGVDKPLPRALDRSLHSERRH